MSSLLTSINRRPFEWVEIDQPLCALTYGTGLCTAAVGVTGDQKCFNTRHTCQDPANFDGSDILTLRFCRNQAQTPDDYIYFPYLQDVNMNPGKINPGGLNSNISGLGIRASLSVTFSDHPYTDRITDPYIDDRDYIAIEQGTFWGKWRARNPYYMHRVIRHKSGLLDENGDVDPDTLITRTFFITGFSGPDMDGTVSIQAKDILSLIANEKAKAPLASTGKLNGAVLIGATSATLQPTGIGNQEYPASGYVRIGDEVCSFTRSGDTLALGRAEYNTDEKDHNDGDVVQLCLEYTSEQAHDIIYDLLVTYAGISSTYLDYANWAIEAADFLPRLYSALITAPEGIATLITEICDQMYLTLYWDERNSLLKLRALRPAENETITDLTDDAHLLEDSVSWTDLADSLITQVWVYYAQINPTKSVNEPSNYAALEIVTDPESEGSDRNGLQKQKVIYSRWISGANGGAAIDLGEKTLARFSQIPRQATFSLDAKDRQLWLADFIQITNRQITDFYGLPLPLQMQVISAQENLAGTRYDYQAIEYIGTFEATEGYYLPISSNQTSVNLRTLFDQLLAVTPQNGDVVTFVVRNGVTIGGEIPNPTYTGNVVYSDSFFDPGFPDYQVTVATTEWPLYKLTRRDFTSGREYYANGEAGGDTYLDPDTDDPLGPVWTDTIEIPSVVSLETGIWPSGVTLRLEVEPGGKILGHGGVGGIHHYLEGTKQNYADERRRTIRAGDGGHAIKASYPITIYNQGIIAGGGGGGSMLRGFIPGLVFSDGSSYAYLPLSGSGGGGAGYPGGAVHTSMAYNTNQGISDQPAGFIDWLREAAEGSETDGGQGAFLAVTAAGTGNGLAVEQSNTGEGKPGYAVQSGGSYITWEYRGDVRGTVNS